MTDERLSPAQYGRRLAEGAPALTAEQVEAAARILAQYASEVSGRLEALDRRVEDLEQRDPVAEVGQGLVWLDTRQAAAHVGKHVDTVRKVLEAAELHGHQRTAGGRWSVHIECLDAWAGDRPCGHLD